MAAVGAQTFVSGRQSVGGGVGPLPEQRRFLCSCEIVPSVFLGNWVLRGAMKQGTSSAWKVNRSTIVSAIQDEESIGSSLRVFKSMQDAAERRKEADFEAAALAAFDEVDIARAISDAESLMSSNSRGKTLQPPRFATLRAFGEAGGQGIVTSGGFQGTSVFELIVANIEASKQVKNWEVLSGRLAMLAISVALGMEVLTGNSVFKGIDTQKLEVVAALCAVATLAAGQFAFAWRAKNDVVDLMAKGYKNMLESALDNLIDGLFFDEV